MLEAVLLIHIAAGTLGLLTGAAALVFRKGAKLHRRAGTAFVVVMLVMAVTIVLLAAFKTLSVGDVGAAVLTIYLVATAWLTVRRKEKKAGVLELAGFGVAALIAVGMFYGAVQRASGAIEAENPIIVYVSFALGGFLALAALGDLSVFLRKGIAGAQRVARHLWRMCLGLVIAVGSFAAQGVEALPPTIPRIELLLGSMALVLAVMVFWLVRVLAFGWPRRTTSAENSPSG